MALRFIADKSALARIPHPPVAARLGPIFGQVATCSVIDLELLFSARTHRHLEELLRERKALPQVEMAQADFDRAIEVIGKLALCGHHRAAGIPDLLIAAVAERHGLTVLHYDKDFDVIAAVTRQPVEWIVPPGTVP